MLADQFLEAAAAARTGSAVDEVSRLLWRAHAEHKISNADAKAISEAVQTRRAALAGKVAQPKAVPEAPRASRRLRVRPREKLFGMGRPRALDRNAKVRIMHLARVLSRRTEKGKAYGAITAKALAVLEALLWSFHNAKTGLCFPSYERIAEAAGSARSTVAEAIKALEDAGILSWVNRLKRVAETGRDLFGHRVRKTRVIRTSNGYVFLDPKGRQAPQSLGHSSKSDFPSGTPNQESFQLKDSRCPAPSQPRQPPRRCPNPPQACPRSCCVDHQERLRRNFVA